MDQRDPEDRVARLSRVLRADQIDPVCPVDQRHLLFQEDRVHQEIHLGREARDHLSNLK